MDIPRNTNNRRSHTTSTTTSNTTNASSAAVVLEPKEYIRTSSSSLIGCRGWTVKHIQDESGARVDIDQTVTPKIIRSSGSDKSQVSRATQMVQDC